MLQLEGNQVALEGASRSPVQHTQGNDCGKKSGGLTGSDYADVIELHTLRNLLKEKLKERDFVFVSNFSLQADNWIRVIFRKKRKQIQFDSRQIEPLSPDVSCIQV